MGGGGNKVVNEKSEQIRLSEGFNGEGIRERMGREKLG